MLKFLLGAAAALALVSAAPAAACSDCQHKKDTTAQAEKSGAVAEADKKEMKTCGCDQSASKECKCGEKCACGACPAHAKKGEKAEKKS
jgi:hypothetical protein